MEYHQAILIKHWDKLIKICDKACCRYVPARLDLSDEMLSDVFDKSETIFYSFDPSRNDDIEGFMLKRFSDYCRKWLSNHFKHSNNDSTVSLESIDPKDFATPSRESAALDAGEEVIELLRVIDNKQDRRLFLLRAKYGWTFTDIAKALSIPESNVRKYYGEILYQLQWYAKQRTKRDIV